jgi:hypothetical protein
MRRGARDAEAPTRRLADRTLGSLWHEGFRSLRAASPAPPPPAAEARRQRRCPEALEFVAFDECHSPPNAGATYPRAHIEGKFQTTASHAHRLIFQPTTCEKRRPPTTLAYTALHPPSGGVARLGRGDERRAASACELCRKGHIFGQGCERRLGKGSFFGPRAAPAARHAHLAGLMSSGRVAL